MQVQGNYVGTNPAGTTAVANSVNGIEIQGMGNTVGGTTSAALNLISGNSNDCGLIDSGASGNLVEGNHIGVNVYDSAPLGNRGNGVEVAGSNNTLGASYAVAPPSRISNDSPPMRIGLSQTNRHVM